MRSFRIIGTTMITFLLVACAAAMNEIRHFPENFNPPVNVVEYNYAAADALIGQAKDSITLNDPISIGALQPMNLKPTETVPPFGRVSADQIANRLVQLGYRVQEADGMAVITGSYTIAQYDILVNLRMVNTHTGRVLAATDYRMPLGTETYKLINRDIFFGQAAKPPKNETEGAPVMPEGDASVLPVRIIPLPER